MFGLRAATTSLRAPSVSTSWWHPHRLVPSVAFSSRLPGLSDAAPSSWSAEPPSPSPTSGNNPLNGAEITTWFSNALNTPDTAPARMLGPPIGTAYPQPNPRKANPVQSAHAIITREHDALRFYGFHVLSTRNNTIITIAKPNGAGADSIITGGTCGFKGQRRATYEAGYQCAIQAIKRLESIQTTDNKMRVSLFLKGFGQGRDAVYKALGTAEAQPVRNMVLHVSDVTPIKIGGTRAKKRRRA